MEENPQFAQSMWQSIPEAWKGIPRLYCGVGNKESRVASLVMLLFSQRMTEEGNRVLRSNHYEKSACRDASVNWKLLKGLELAGNVQECLALADRIRSLTQSENSLSSPLCMDAIIHCYCKQENFKEVELCFDRMQKESMKVEQATYDCIMELYASTGRWRDVYEKMKERAKEKKMELSEEEWV